VRAQGVQPSGDPLPTLSEQPGAWQSLAASAVELSQPAETWGAWGAGVRTRGTGLSDACPAARESDADTVVHCHEVPQHGSAVACVAVVSPFFLWGAHPSPAGVQKGRTSFIGLVGMTVARVALGSCTAHSARSNM